MSGLYRPKTQFLIYKYLKGDLRMGKADTIVKQWLGDRERFADLFNGTLFGGEQVVKPEELVQLRGGSRILFCETRIKKTARSDATGIWS